MAKRKKNDTKNHPPSRKKSKKEKVDYDPSKTYLIVGDGDFSFGK